ncbi:GNAT family N-acetyltransferase [Halorubrum sp. DTA98]|uniref:GNAT family N-acetyltransferase n=1 Tax=Halorubrum sp. DTA98 TaxID=3402163 RepID=UPI003AAB89DC
MELRQLSLREWDDALPETGIEAFHTPDALSVLDDHTASDLQLVGGFKGERPVALLPVFVQSLPIGTVVTSPPPGMGVPRLGPVMMPASPKQRKREKVFRTFTNLVVDEFGLDGYGTLSKITCRTGFEDPRPYVWKDLSLDTKFTYRLDVSESDPDDLLRQASKSLRREVRDATELDVTVTREGIDAARHVFEQTRDRYAEQDRPFSQEWSYVRDLYRALGEMARVYVARSDDGEFLTGVTVFYSPDAAYFWQGGGRTVHDGVAVNSLIHWRILEEIATDPPRDTVTAYDLYGANTERLCRYKSKFGAELVPYYSVGTAGYRMTIAERLYELVK